MARRRMFSLDIVDTDAFLDMPHSSQLLYFHLSMRADDDGFVSNPKRIMRAINSQDDDMKVLLTKRFIIPFDSGICVIKHWRINNYIQKDRYTETTYRDEKKLLNIKDNKSYTLKPSDNSDKNEDVYILNTKKSQNVYSLDTQYRIGKERKEIRVDQESEINKLFNQFWSAYPRHVNKKSTLKVFLKIAPSPELLEKILSSIEAWKKSEQWSKDGGKFIPHPTTWLNGERWEDETKIDDKSDRLKRFGIV
jgi:hypothetical protein